LCYTFALMTDNGEELSFVQRAEGLGIAPDCISVGGGTPGFDDRFFEPEFDFAKFYNDGLEDQMDHEFKLSPSEWGLEKIYLINDADTLPCLVTRIKTPVSTGGIAKRIYRDERAVSEHPILALSGIDFFTRKILGDY